MNDSPTNAEANAGNTEETVQKIKDAYQKIRHGASLVQLYTALLYQGPGVVRRINQGLVRLLERDGFANVSDSVGMDVDTSNMQGY